MPRDHSSLIVVDVETTGFCRSDRVVEIAAVRLDPETGEIVDEYDTLVQPGRDVGHTGIHGITPSMLELAPTFEEILGDVARRLHGQIPVAHNLPFDRRFLRQEFERCGVRLDPGVGICTLRTTRQRLAVACDDHGVVLECAHRALADARATAALLARLAARGKSAPPSALRPRDAKSPLNCVAGRSSHGQAARIAARFPPPSFAGRGTPPPRTPPRSALRADERSPDFLHRLLGLDRPEEGHEPVRIGYIGRRPTKRALRRDLAASEAPAMPRVVSLVHYPHCDEAVSQYLDALDHALDDGVLDDEERAEMRRLAEEWGIPEPARQRAHREYFDAVVDAAKRDGVITPREREVIENLARQLEIPDAGIPGVTRLAEVTVLQAGSRVCFTGRVVLGGIPRERGRLEALAMGQGLRVAAGVSRKGCDLLVSADAASASGKARTARRPGIPIWSAVEFVERTR